MALSSHAAARKGCGWVRGSAYGFGSEIGICMVEEGSRSRLGRSTFVRRRLVERARAFFVRREWCPAPPLAPAMIGEA